MTEANGILLQYMWKPRVRNPWTNVIQLHVVVTTSSDHCGQSHHSTHCRLRTLLPVIVIVVIIILFNFFFRRNGSVARLFLCSYPPVDGDIEHNYIPLKWKVFFCARWLASSEVINQVLFTPEHRPARKILKKTIIFLFSVNRTNRTVNFTGFTSNCVSQWESFLFNEQKSWRFPTLSRWVEWKYKYTWKWWTNRNGKKGYLDHCDWRLDFLRAVQIKP